MAGNFPVKANQETVKKPIDKLIDHKPEGGMYPMTGGPVPKSSQIQMWANEKNISLETIDVGKDDDQAWAKVRAIVTETGQFVESMVVLRYRDVEQRKMISQVDKIIKESGKRSGSTPTIRDMSEPFIVTDDGRIMANYTPRGLMDFMKQMVNYRYTAERTAETMAARRAEWKILNKEWKDETEANAEKLEDGEDETEKEKTEEKVKEIKKPEQEGEKVKTFKQQPKEEKPKEEIKEPKEDVKNEEKTEERTAKEEPSKAPSPEKKTDGEKGVSGSSKPIKRPTARKKSKVNQELFPPTREKEDYKGVDGKEIVNMIRKDLEGAGLEPEMKNISVMLRNLKKEKKIIPHQFRVANEYNMDMAF